MNRVLDLESETVEDAMPPEDGVEAKAANPPPDVGDCGTCSERGTLK
jgi:hypothetical protein